MRSGSLDVRAGQIAAGEAVPAGRPWREVLTERKNGR
jgi:hypothetical protein